MRRVLVVYNPVAGAKSKQDVEGILRRGLKKRGFEVDWFETDAHEEQPLEPYVGKRYFRVIVVGGDGTISQVVSFMMKHDWKIPLVIIPQGSGNLLAKALGLPLLSVSRALKVGLEKKPSALDVICVNKKRYGLIAVGRGYDVFLMENTSREAKRSWGFWAYVWVMLKTMFSYRPKVYELVIDGKKKNVEAKSVMLVNIFPLSGLVIKPNDGWLNGMIMGRHHQMTTFKAKKVTIRAEREHQFELDGDVFKGRTVKVELLPRAISFVSSKKF